MEHFELKGSKAKDIMDPSETNLVIPEKSKITIVTLRLARLLLGILLVVSVVVRLIIPAASEGFSPQAANWLAAMDATGYMPFLLMGTELLVGIAFITGRFVPLALVVFAPINLNIFLLHSILDPRPIRLLQIAFMAAAHLYLVWGYWEVFRPIIFSPRQPTILQLRHQRYGRPSLMVRTLLGGLFLLTGLAKILDLVGAQSAFITAIQQTGYLYVLLGILETIIGVMLISGIAVPLALIMLSPILVNILAYHAFLDRASPLAIVALGAALALASLAWMFRDLYQPLLQPQIGPILDQP